MNRLQEAFVHAASVVINLLIYKYIKDPELAAIFIAGVGAFQATLGIRAFSKNPDGTPAEISYIKVTKVEKDLESK